MRERMIVGLCFAVTVWSGGCGRNLEVSDEIKASQRDVIHGDIQLARNAARFGSLRCNVKSECEPALALVSTVSVDPQHREYAIERCTGFLISSREIMTNDHCIGPMVGIPRDARENIPCEDKIFVHFVDRSGGPGPTVGCKQIKVRSGINGVDSVDYAIIELDTEITDRHPVPLSKRGFRDGEEANILVVNMTSGQSGKYGGVQNLLRCQATYETYLFPAIHASNSPFMTFGDCAIEKGNSGAPMFNEDGEVSAINQAYFEPNPAHPQTSALKDALIDGDLGRLAFATSTACLKSVVPDGESCAARLSAGNIPLDAYMKKYQKFENEQLPELKKGWMWEAIKGSSDSKKSFFSHPLCTTDASFKSRTIEYELKMSSKLKPIWYSDGSELEVLFGRGSPLNPSVNQYHSDLGSLPIQVCAE